MINKQDCSSQIPCARGQAQVRNAVSASHTFRMSALKPQREGRGNPPPFRSSPSGSRSTHVSCGSDQAEEEPGTQRAGYTQGLLDPGPWPRCSLQHFLCVLLAGSLTSLLLYHPIMIWENVIPHWLFMGLNK